MTVTVCLILYLVLSLTVTDQCGIVLSAWVEPFQFVENIYWSISSLLVFVYTSCEYHFLYTPLVSILLMTAAVVFPKLNI